MEPVNWLSTSRMSSARAEFPMKKAPAVALAVFFKTRLRVWVITTIFTRFSVNHAFSATLPPFNESVRALSIYLISWDPPTKFPYESIPAVVAGLCGVRPPCLPGVAHRPVFAWPRGARQSRRFEDGGEAFSPRRLDGTRTIRSVRRNGLMPLRELRESSSGHQFLDHAGAIAMTFRRNPDAVKQGEPRIAKRSILGNDDVLS